MNHLVPCPSCARHLRANESTCPFCAAEMPSTRASSPPPRMPSKRLGRSALMSFRSAPSAVAAAALAIGCGGAGGEPVGPVYGGPPPNDRQIEQPPPPEDNEEREEADPVAPPKAEDPGEPVAPMYGGPPTATPPPDDPGETKAMYGVPPAD